MGGQIGRGASLAVQAPEKKGEGEGERAKERQRCRRGRDCTSVGASATYTKKLQACDMFRPLQTSSSSVTEAVESSRVGASVVWAGGRVGWFFRLPGSSPAHLGSASKWLGCDLRNETCFCERRGLESAKAPSQVPNPVAKASGTATAHRIGSSRRTRGLTGRAVWPCSRQDRRLTGLRVLETGVQHPVQNIQEQKARTFRSVAGFAGALRSSPMPRRALPLRRCVHPMQRRN